MSRDFDNEMEDSNFDEKISNENTEVLEPTEAEKFPISGEGNKVEIDASRTKRRNQYSSPLVQAFQEDKKHSLANKYWEKVKDARKVHRMEISVPLINLYKIISLCRISEICGLKRTKKKIRESSKRIIPNYEHAHTIKWIFPAFYQLLRLFFIVVPPKDEIEETEEKEEEKLQKKSSLPTMIGKGLFFLHYYFLPTFFILFFSVLTFVWGSYYSQPFYEIPKPLLVFRAFRSNNNNYDSFLREHSGSHTPSHTTPLTTQQLITKWTLSLVNAVFLGGVIWFCYTFSLGLTRDIRFWRIAEIVLKFYQKQDEIRLQKSKLGTHKLKLPELASKILGTGPTQEEEEEEFEEDEELMTENGNPNNDPQSGKKGDLKNRKKGGKKRRKKATFATPKISLSNEYENRQNLLLPETVKGTFADENNTPAGNFAGEEHDRMIQLQKENEKKMKDAESDFTRKREKLFLEIHKVFRISNLAAFVVMIILVVFGAFFIEAKKIVKSYNGFLAYKQAHPKEKLDIFTDFLTPENLVFFGIDALIYLVLYLLASLNVFVYFFACAIAYICFDECLKRGLTKPEDINARTIKIYAKVSNIMVSLNHYSFWFIILLFFYAVVIVLNNVVFELDKEQTAQITLFEKQFSFWYAALTFIFIFFKFFVLLIPGAIVSEKKQLFFKKLQKMRREQVINEKLQMNTQQEELLPIEKAYIKRCQNNITAIDSFLLYLNTEKNSQFQIFGIPITRMVVNFAIAGFFVIFIVMVKYYYDVFNK